MLVSHIYSLPLTGILIVCHSVIVSFLSSLISMLDSLKGVVSFMPIRRPPPLLVSWPVLCCLSFLMMVYPGIVGVLSLLIILVSCMAKTSILFSCTNDVSSTFFDDIASAFHCMMFSFFMVDWVFPKTYSTSSVSCGVRCGLAIRPLHPSQVQSSLFLMILSLSTLNSPEHLICRW